MKLSMFDRMLNWMVGAAIEVKAARVEEAYQHEIKNRFNDKAAKAAIKSYGITSMTSGRAANLSRRKITPDEVNATGSHDSRPYQASVEQAVIDAGGSNYRAWQASGEAMHLSPEYIAGKYGDEAGQAALELQQHNAAR